MAVGLGILRLPPRQFWAMTPRELAATLRVLAGVVNSGPPLSRSELDALMHRFPDAQHLRSCAPTL